MVSIEEKSRIYDKLEVLKKCLYNPFPKNDIDKIYDDFDKQFSDDDSLSGDLNTYWMNIAGSLSYLLKGNSKKIPQSQIDWLHLNFFDIFNQYKFLEEKIIEYPTFYKEYMNYESVRKLMVDYLSLN